MENTLFQALQVRFIKVRFTLTFTQDSELPQNKIPFLRDGMKSALIRRNCVRNGICRECDFCAECTAGKIAYPSDVPEDFRTEDSSGETGYLLECESSKTSWKAEETLDFYLTLFGKTIVYFRQIADAFRDLGTDTQLCGKQYGFTVTSIRNFEKEKIFDNSGMHMQKLVVHTVFDYVMFRKLRLEDAMEINSVIIILDSMLTLEQNRIYLQGYRIESILDAVKRRLYALNSFENRKCELCETAEPLPVDLKQKAHLRGNAYYSNYTPQKMEMQGLKGSIHLSGITEDILDLLIAGELLHIGTNFEFGYGRYHLKST